MEGFDRDDVESIASSSVREADQGARCFYNDPSLTSAGSMPFRGFRIGLFVKKVGDTARFYYEPIAALDSTSVALKSHSTDQFQVNFILEMWNATLEDEVAKYLQQDPKLVQVMPYEEVRLVNAGDGAFQLPSRPTSYLRLNESLNFSVICDAKEFPELANQLSIECKSPATGQPDGIFHHGALGVKRLTRFPAIVNETNGTVLSSELKQNEAAQHLETANQGKAF